MCCRVIKFAPPFYQVITNEFLSINHETVGNERLISSSSSTEHTINNDNIINKHQVSFFVLTWFCSFTFIINCHMLLLSFYD